MSRSKTAILWIFCLAIGLLVPPARAQQITYKPGEYPAPRYPKIPKNPTLEDLMPVARAIVKRDDIGASFYPGYAIKAGERALIMVGREYDPLVLEAIQRAVREAGAKVDVLLGDEVHPNSKDGSWNGDGSAEFQFFLHMDDVERMQAGGILRKDQVAIAKAGKYDVVLSGQGGGAPRIPGMRWRYLPWDWIDKFLVNGANVPPDLLKFIDDTAWTALTQAVSIRATDPEGTDITWNTKPQEWQSPGLHNPGHLMSHPSRGGATGILAGTFNHTGPYPQIRASVNNDRVEGLEGGGAYGEKWRSVRDEYKDVNWPGKTGPGLFTWLFEAAIGTNPKSARPRGVLDRARANTWERTRAGIIHWGIGGEPSGLGGPAPSTPPSASAEFITNFQELTVGGKKLPNGHVHIHNYFLTMTLTNADGSKAPLINKGHMTTLDDPSVRQQAAKFGDPDQLLREDWIPAIPGINVPGDYRRDYASDPAGWIRKDLASNWQY